MLLAEHEDRVRQREILVAAVRRCRVAALCGPRERDLHRDAHTFDILPWVLAEGLLAGRTDQSQYTFLRQAIGHGASATRGFGIECAWAIRTRLEVEPIADVLFNNIATCLLFVDESAVLARDLSRSDEAFWSRADEFHPPSAFADQYWERLSRYRATPPWEGSNELFEAELAARRIVDREILSIDQTD